MSEALYVELPAEQKPLPFWKSKRGIALCVFLLLILLAAIFSWWLSRGKISSAAARLDTLVYTVEPEFSTQIQEIYASPGDMVGAGQPLARVDVSALGSKDQKSIMEIERLRQIPGMRAIAERLGAAQKAERDMAARLAQARFEEEKYRKAREERVTEHVRSQLAMRSLDRRNVGAYEEASRVEQAARSRMEAAKAEFEQVSRQRAAIDMELARIRNDIIRTRKRANLGDPPAVANQENVAVKSVDDYLYSPVNGRVLRVDAMRGQMAIQGEPVFYILPKGDNVSSDYWVQAWFPAADRESLKVGQKVIIKFDNGLHLNGKVEAISDAAQSAPVQQNASGSVNLNSVNVKERGQYSGEKYIPAKISLDNPSRAASMEPGAKAECQIQTRYFLGF